MKRIIAVMVVMMSILMAALTIVTIQKGTVENAYASTFKEDGTKWRIGYCESEDFITFTETLIGIVHGLEELGWIRNLDGFDIVAYTRDSKAIWNYLANRDIGPYIEFVDDGFYNLRDEGVTPEDIVDRLQRNKDIDLMLVMGTQAGISLSTDDHDTNIFVFAASNAVRSGIIDSVEDSGKDHVWAHMDEQRFERQIKAFHDIVQFEKIGMVYEDSDIARVYSAVNEVEKLAKDKGFEIVRYHVDEPLRSEEYSRYYQEVQEAYNQLAQEVDAVFVTIASLESDKLPTLFTPFYEKKIPVFSQLGNIEVEHGALMTISVMDEVNLGRFGADTIGKYLEGTKPRDLEQSFQVAPKIILNAEVAQKIDFMIPFELIIVIDEVYENIAK
ncbi:ABC transporter substrate-binding protein [Heliorestis convoluta]|uniref:ABC transporter substrate binding protein, putative n=1 Tax=Heliorestis convoluta TaxID=356322 RepID=A0A5Q2N157_9FIRM|nr:ABC transporter substrate binding protein [Heliorestis convoluta]QGG48081.1 ABC transporter substrate binding protein, putative [Heliorestis convoluta]